MKRVHTSLFGAHDGTDPIYNRLRNPAPKKSDTSEILARGRARSEELWSRTAEFLDSDLPDKATRQFHQCFWEMYLAASLLDLNLALVPRAERKKPSVGPDLQVAPNIWLEAIAVTSGAGPDAVPDTTSGPANKAHDVPDEQITLRLISGITEKRNKFDSYRQNGIVGSDDVCIVALNAALVPPLNFEWFPPRIVRAVMEFGHPVVAMDRSSREIIERTNEHRRLSRSSPAAPFLRGYSGMGLAPRSARASTALLTLDSRHILWASILSGLTTQQHRCRSGENYFSAAADRPSYVPDT